MKKLVKSIMIITVFSVLMLIGTGKKVSAYETYQYGNLYYTLTLDGNEVEITGCESDTTDVTIPTQIDGMNVTEIADYAFEKHYDLKSVRTESVIHIGTGAFQYCDSLKQVYAPSAVSVDAYAFDECDQLSNVIIGQKESSKDRYMEGGVFYRCTSLKNIDIGYIQKIDNNVFNGCTSLETAIMPSVTSLGDQVFKDCALLKNVQMPNVEEIGEKTFYNCKSLGSVSANKISRVEDEAFVNTDLTKLSFANDVSYIGDHAIGYNYQEDKYGRDVWTKQEGFTIHCSSSGNIYAYARDNGFSYENHWLSTKSQENATCTNDGRRTEVCSVCGYERTITIPKEGHSFGPAVVTTEPSCMENGVETQVCSRCGYEKTATIPSYENHIFGEGVVTTKPTCTSDGQETKVCSRCGYKITVTIAKYGHSFKEGVITTKPTCTRDGKKTEVCSRCGYEKTIIIPKYGKHMYDAGVVTTKPTNTKNGIKTYTCKRCGEKKTTSLKSYKTLATEKYKNYVKNLWNCKYKIIDVDKNGIPELLIKDSDNYKVIAYTYNSKSNKMVKIKSLSFGKGGMLKYNTKSHCLSFVTADTGGFREYIYKLSGTRLKAVRTITYNNGKFGKQGYKIKKKKISSSKYKKYLKGFKSIK